MSDRSAVADRASKLILINLSAPPTYIREHQLGIDRSVASLYRDHACLPDIAVGFERASEGGWVYVGITWLIAAHKRADFSWNEFGD